MEKIPPPSDSGTMVSDLQPVTLEKVKAWVEFNQIGFCVGASRIWKYPVIIFHKCCDAVADRYPEGEAFLYAQHPDSAKIPSLLLISKPHLKECKSTACMRTGMEKQIVFPHAGLFCCQETHLILMPPLMHGHWVWAEYFYGSKMYRQKCYSVCRHQIYSLSCTYGVFILLNSTFCNAS